MLTPDTAPKLPSTPFRFALHFLGRFRWYIIPILVFELGQATTQILIPHSIRRLIDAVPQHADIWGPVWEFIALSVGILICSRLSGILLIYLAPKLRKAIRSDLYHYLQHHSQRYFLGNFAGSLANRIGEVSTGVQFATWVFLFDFWPIAITFAVSWYLLVTTHAALAWVLTGWIVAFVGFSFWLALKARSYAKDYAAARSLVTGKIVDAVTNIANAKLFSRLGFEREYLDSYLQREVNRAMDSGWFHEKMRWFNFISTLALQVGMILYALTLWRQGSITVGGFAMVTSLVLLLINEARNLSRRFLEFFEYVGNITDGVSVIIKPHEILDPPQPEAFQVSDGLIQFDNVTFGYQSERPLFKDLNVTIRAGERVGLVGFSGSGKTTFMNLILRLFDIQKGAILIDGQAITQVRQSDLRARLSLIPQDPILFHRSLMENIRYGRLDATDNEVIEAARLADADSFIREQKDGYAALVGERGVRLSGGQRQRIAIARAILKNAPVLLMDEATSSLDSVTEKSIQTSLGRLMQGRTVVVIAHRLSTIAHLDRILVFDKGKVIEDGSHSKLLALHGQYARLWSMQVDGFLPESETGEIPTPIH